MESLHRVGTNMYEFWRGMIEWRSPASGPYLMLVNMVFWSAALYCSELVQLRLLLSIAAGVVSWDILLAPTHERSIAMHILLWPIQSIWRTLSVCGCLYSSQQLKLQQLERACIAAYATVGCLLVNPVWDYYEVNQKIANGAVYCGKKTADAATIVIVRPMLQIYQVLKYIVLLQFVPPVWRAIKSAAARTGTAIKNGYNNVMNGIKKGAIYVVMSIKNGVVRVVAAIRDGFVYVVTTIKNGIIYVATSIKNGVLYVVTSIKNGICWVGRGIKNGVLATVFGIKNGIQATARYIADLCCRMGNWIHMYIIEPTKNGIFAVGRWLRYWFCAYWWPDLKEWMKIRIGQPLQRVFNYFCYGLMYVTCGYWIPPLKSFLGKWLGRCKDFIMAQMRRLGGYLHETVVVPAKNHIRQKFDEFRSWLRQFLHRIAVSIRDSILWPICLLFVDAGRELTLLMYRLLLRPILDYVYGRYKILETGILVNFLGPVCDTIVKNIPEKSPFCDDSDVELEGMLPDEISVDLDQAAGGSESEDSLLELAPPAALLPDVLEEEGDFHSGLAFPAIHNSESSDDEFDLTKPKKEAKRKSRKQRETDDVGVAPEVPVVESETRQRRNGGAQALDDDFELLQ
ncbi:unnamed protein product [Cylicocyclus nassatus]|uniref:Uncharacterized protein n=1 Tax=Cylicocyclus nassatus TaxID=53992 RepID=A0AA36GS78_CYLNA|nr:unnamed protein product [Cylicocyclus nassatus]